MSDTPEPNAAPELRASDLDRERVAERLREAAGHGRLTMDELEERVGLAYSAKTYAELVPLTRDLPASDGPAFTPASAPASNRLGGTPTRKRWSIGVMSGPSRRGHWVVPRRYNAFAIWGGVVLDLREANFAEPMTVIRASALMGGVEIIVPEDLDVRVEGFGFMGGYEDIGDSVRPAPASPVVRVTGIAVMAGVQVKRKGPKKQKLGEGGERAELTEG
jgi:hypothetical protein